jgi:hypothetical protein
MGLLGIGSVVCLLLGACSSGRRSPTAGPRDGGVDGSVQAATSRAVSPTDPEADAELVVGTDWGLEAWRRDGSSKRLISKGPARYPRWLDKTTVLVVQPSAGDDLGRGGAIESISLVDGQRRLVAELPPFACAGEPESPGLVIHDPGDFVVDRSGKVLCLTLMDRNINMVGVAVAARIELATGKVSRWLEFGAEDCTPPPGVTVGKMAECLRRAEDKRAEPAPGRRFVFADEHVREGQGPGALPTVKLAGYEGALRSPSQRWQVLRGDVQEADYIHSRLVLLDQITGEVFPIRDEPGPWPPPLKPVAGKSPPRFRTPVKGTIEVVGESDVRWLGRGLASELLVVDDLVVRPRQPSFVVKGLVAQ